MAISARIYTPSARAKGRAKQFVHNRDVWVILADSAEPVRNINSPAVQRREYFGRADSRYDGPRSYYGYLLQRAQARVLELQIEWEGR